MVSRAPAIALAIISPTLRAKLASSIGAASGSEDHRFSGWASFLGGLSGFLLLRMDCRPRMILRLVENLDRLIPVPAAAMIALWY
jgi:hypothetical protein